MEPRQDKPKTAEFRTEKKPTRLRIVALEPRIAASFQWGAVHPVDQLSINYTKITM
jgi:hypothetical protein